MTQLVFDRQSIAQSVRHIDDNGFLHVDISNLTKEQVVPYLGREIPDHERLNLEPEKVYYCYRSAAELSKPETIASINGIPIQLDHHEDYADDPAQDTRVGSTGTDGAWNTPYLTNSLHIQNKSAINRINDGSMREISLGYRFTPVAEPGTFNGTHYDILITDISCNHVALVNEGRAGHDVVVKDGLPGELKNMGDQTELATQALLDNVLTSAQAVKDIQDADNSAVINANEGDPAMDENTTPQDQPAKDSKDDLINAFLADIGAAGIDVNKARERLNEIINADKPAEDEAPEAETATDEAPEDNSEDKPVGEETVGDAENDDDKLIEDAVKACGLDDEPDEIKKAFAAGMRYGEKEDKPEAEQSENEGEKKPLGEDSLINITRAVQQRLQAQYSAAEECRGTLGRVNAMAYDSAGEIYRAACKKLGLRVQGLSGRECRAAYRAVQSTSKRAAPLAQDSKPQQPSALAGFLNNVKVGV